MSHLMALSVPSPTIPTQLGILLAIWQVISSSSIPGLNARGWGIFQFTQKQNFTSVIFKNACLLFLCYHRLHLSMDTTQKNMT